MAQIFLLRFIFCLIISLTIEWGSSHVSSLPKEDNGMQENTNYTKILNFWQKHEKELLFHDDHKEVVLVMGNTGSRKSTLISALVRKKLEVINSKGYFVIVDEEHRIGIDTPSKTLIPELMIDDKRKVTYIDCPGFRHNRGIEYEISSIYFQNILMNQVEKIKLILVINHDSLTINGNKNDFDNLLENFSEFVKNISKFQDGIALVVTKVSNSIGIDKDGKRIILNDNQLVFNGIADYLKDKKNAYSTKMDNSKKYQILVKLIDILLQKNNNLYSRIALFRNPTQKGLLENDPIIKSEIHTISQMIIENLHYVEKQKDDFSLELSVSSKETVEKIIYDIFRNALTNHVHKFGIEIFTHYLQMEKQCSDIRILRDKVSYAYDLVAEIENIDSPEVLFEKFVHMSNTLNVSLLQTYLGIISDDIKILRYFTTVLNNKEYLYMMSLKNEVQKTTDSMENFKNFYEFLNHLEDQLAKYNSQYLKDDPRIENILVSCATSTDKVIQDIPDLGNIITVIGSNDYYQKITTFKLNQFQLNHLKAVFSAFAKKLEFFCTSPSGPMIVKGYNIKISDVIRNDCWVQAKSIQILALNKVFIDETMNKTGEMAELFIFAPTWEVVGGPNIILDGKAGESHKNVFARSALNNFENGADGLPGLPGGPAGNFFGVGQQFINLNFLKIHANGGEGGPGQHGGNGADGIRGKELPASFYETFTPRYEVLDYIMHNNYEGIINENLTSTDSENHTPAWEFLVYGKPATKPTHGGDGGAGGEGGYPGEIIVINSSGKSVDVLTSRNSGSIGLKGQGGHGGKSTFNGRSTEFRLWYHDLYVKAEHGKEGTEVPAGKDGIAGKNTKNRVNPQPPTTMILYSAINSFKFFVRMNLFRSTKEYELNTFISELESNEQIKAQYNTNAFVEELKGLENQSLEFRNKIDFVSFYHSFLTRINEYFKSENIIENKKVLSYMYTAALTKIILLKKTRKSQTVVDLPKYLETIENSIKKIDRLHHLKIVQEYRDDFKISLNKKIQEANNFIQNTIEPGIDQLWDESDNHMNAIIDEINENRNEMEERIETLRQEKGKIRDMMIWRAVLLPLKLSGIFLSFAGPIGAVVGAAVTTTATIVEGVALDETSSLGENRIHTLDPNLKVMSRITEVVNNKYQLASQKTKAAMAKLEEYEKELSQSNKNIKRKIKTLKTQLQEAISRRANGFSEYVQKIKDIEEIKEKMCKITNWEKDILEKKKEQDEKVQDAKKEKKYEKRLRLINDAQSILNGVEIVYSFTRKLANDKGKIEKINNQVAEYNQQLKILEQMENQVLNIITPDICQIEETINKIKRSVNGSSHTQLDVTKWKVRTTLNDVKLLLQKFTRKMSFELQSNLQRYIEKIDESFSILIDIYDRIDSYLDSVKQAEYIAHIESPTMIDIHVNDAKLSQAVNELKLIIYSNILTEKYEIALYAFKQHFFPFAAHFLKRFQLPTSMQLDDTETLKSNIINIINDMKIYIADSDATIRPYSEYIHRKKLFNSNIIGSSPFYVWKYDTIKHEVQQLLNGSEIILKADIFKGLFLNAIKYNDIGINLKLKNDSLQSNLTSILRNFKLTMKMIGNNYYRCSEQYYSISFDDRIIISYIFNQDKEGNWYDPNEIYTLIHNSHTFLSPYGMWSIKLESINDRVSFDHLNIYANKTIDIELVGQGYYIDQNADFNFEVCNKHLNTFYSIENPIKMLSYNVE